jgi:L-ascorbate metabolism protein UlaG (beta-lactamase superfamily)
MAPLNRQTAITYLGHSTLLIETPGGKRLLIDPWTTGNPACPAEWKDAGHLGRIDMILITHMHSDHVGDAEELIRANPDSVVVGIFEAAQHMAKLGAKHIEPMNKGGSIQVGALQVTMTHAFHSSSFESDSGGMAYGGEPAGYVLKLENGFTCYAAGDTALFGDMSLIKELYRPDLAFLPIGDRFTMGPLEAAYAVRLLGVSHVVPIHYATFPLLTGTPQALTELLADLPDVAVHVVKPGETLR